MTAVPAMQRPVQHGPLRRVVARHRLTAQEMQDAGLDAWRELLTLECGHYVLRRVGIQVSARCGTCAE